MFPPWPGSELDAAAAAAPFLASRGQPQRVADRLSWPRSVLAKRACPVVSFFKSLSNMQKQYSSFTPLWLSLSVFLPRIHLEEFVFSYHFSNGRWSFPLVLKPLASFVFLCFFFLSFSVFLKPVWELSSPLKTHTHTHTQTTHVPSRQFAPLHPLHTTRTHPLIDKHTQAIHTPTHTHTHIHTCTQMHVHVRNALYAFSLP